jgi:hypothetical protein
MVNSLIEAFDIVRQQRLGDEMYYYWNDSLLKTLRISKIPLTLVDEKRKSALTDSPWGLRHFHPWFLSDQDSASNDGFLHLMTDLLEYNHNVIQEKKYWFLRVDCNIFNFWIKV